MAHHDQPNSSDERPISTDRARFEQRVRRRASRRLTGWWQGGGHGGRHLGDSRRADLGGALQMLPTSRLTLAGLRVVWIQALAVRSVFRLLPWRRILQVAVPSLAGGLAVASTLVVQGYVDNPPAWAAQRLAERTGHGLYSQEGALMGALFEPARAGTGLPVDHASLGHVPLQGSLPSPYVDLLLALEHQGHFNPWRNWCGSDPLAMVKRMASGTGGGSTLANQLAKQLREPEVKRSSFAPWALVQKMQEMGAACALHRQLGGAQGVLRMFADTAPVAQVAGTSRGVAAGAQDQEFTRLPQPCRAP